MQTNAAMSVEERVLTALSVSRQTGYLSSST